MEAAALWKSETVASGRIRRLLRCVSNQQGSKSGLSDEDIASLFFNADGPLVSAARVHRFVWDGVEASNPPDDYHCSPSSSAWSDDATVTACVKVARDVASDQLQIAAIATQSPTLHLGRNRIRSLLVGVATSSALHTVRLTASGITDLIVEDLVVALTCCAEFYPKRHLVVVDVSKNPLVTSKGGAALVNLVRHKGQHPEHLPLLQAVFAVDTLVPRAMQKRIDALLDETVDDPDL